ncbi:MAG: hypothetical protein ACI8SR_001538 [Oceanicoccus sp.]|jgi:uncharacterized protein YbaA (DUF1428 family)
MNYIDGFMAAVPTANKQAYLDMAKRCVPIFKKHGMISMTECWGDDVPDGKITSMPMAVKCQENETVIFSWMVWPDKATRDTGMQAAMKDPDMNMDPDKMPFDGKRMIFGGFNVILES